MVLLTFAQTSLAVLTQAEINTVLGEHNNVRANVQPTAANMTRLAWDTNLATVAQNWANQCTWAHNGNRNVDYAALSANTGQVGENIFVTTRTRAAALGGAFSAVTNWASEAASYNYATNTCAPGAICGHYTQLAWANTLRVGCAVTQCASMNGLGPEFNNSQFVVCDYNPTGNFSFNGVLQLPYVAGATGSQCPPSLPNVVGGLCSPASGSPPKTTIPAIPTAGLLVLAVMLGALGRWKGVIQRRGSRSVH